MPFALLYYAFCWLLSVRACVIVCHPVRVRRHLYKACAHLYICINMCLKYMVGWSEITVFISRSLGMAYFSDEGGMQIIKISASDTCMCCYYTFGKCRVGRRRVFLELFLTVKAVSLQRAPARLNGLTAEVQGSRKTLPDQLKSHEILINVGSYRLPF